MIYVVDYAKQLLFYCRIFSYLSKKVTLLHCGKKVKNVKHVFTESHPEQHELVTTRQMEN